MAFGFDVLDRVEQAVAMVKERLKRAVAALDAAGIPHAVVGGHAVAAWVARIDPAAVRTTVDVDLLIDRVDLPRAIAALEAVGFVHSFTFGINIFVDGPQGKAREAVRIHFAGEPVKPADPAPAPELCPVARSGRPDAAPIERHGFDASLTKLRADAGASHHLPTTPHDLTAFSAPAWRQVRRSVARRSIPDPRGCRGAGPRRHGRCG